MKFLHFFCISLIAISLVNCSADDAGSPLPTLTTSAVTNISGISMQANGTISESGSDAIQQYGFCWSLQHNPTMNDFIYYEYGSNSGVYSAQITVEQPNKTYYLKSFAVTNSNDVIYGNEVSFTSQQIILAQVPTSILTTSVLLRGTTVESSNLTLSTMGFCFNTSPNPTVINQQNQISGGFGNFTIPVTNLTPNTVYYAKPFYYTNTGALFYGNEISFKTTGYFGPSGGYVFYDKGEITDGWRYMELAPATLNYTTTAVGADWGCNTTLLSFTYPDFGKGLENTEHIVSTCPVANSAARLCYNYSINGLTDWFLPSKNELEVIYSSLKKEGFLNSSVYNYIWSSTEFDASNAVEVWFIYDTNSESVVEPKSYNGVVTPVRRY